MTLPGNRAPHLDSLLRPASVAVVGARDDTSTFGGRVWTYLTRDYRGRATAVNARAGAVRSGPCVATLADVDPAPEAVVLATRSDTVIGLLEQAGAMGSLAAVIFARDLLGREDEINAVATRFGMTVLGPNCLGLINANAGVNLSSSISLERRGRPGPLAFVSQSGALMGLLHARATDLGLGLGLGVSTGSQAVLRAEDVLLELAGRDDITAAGVYLESIDVPWFTMAARALGERGIRLIALRAGATPAGSRAATAHSGALAGSGAAFAALARDLGVVTVDDLGEFLTTLALASTTGPRWHITSSSGGIATIAADQATGLGIELPQPRSLNAPAPAASRNPSDLDAGVEGWVGPLADPSDLDAGVEGWVGPLADPSDLGAGVEGWAGPLADPSDLGAGVEGWAGPLANPSDLDAGAATTRQKTDLISALAGAPDLDGVLVVVSDMPLAEEFIRELAAVARQHDGRVFVVSECSGQLAPLWREWVDAGLAYLAGLAPALRAIGRLHGRAPGWTGAASGSNARLVPPGAVEALPPGEVAGLAGQARGLLPGAVEALLGEAGLPVLCSREAGSAAAARSAAESLGYPVVVKVSRAPHRGTHQVRLGLRDADEVAAAYAELAPHGPVLVQRQAASGLEFYVGVRADPVFGRLLLVGAGGPRVEELADVAIGREPLEPDRIRDLVASTRAGRWLASPASQALFDIGALAQVAGQALDAFTRSAGLESLDLNPVVVTQAGATIVDAKASGRWPRPATEVPA